MIPPTLGCYLLSSNIFKKSFNSCKCTLLLFTQKSELFQKCDQVRIVGIRQIQNQILAERNYIVSAYKCPRVLGLR